MPRISEFFGIHIYMYFRDHNPPHFHVLYNEHKAIIKIEDMSIVIGTLPPRVYGLVVEWGLIHKADLMDRWAKALRYEKLEKIQPLE